MNYFKKNIILVGALLCNLAFGEVSDFIKDPSQANAFNLGSITYIADNTDQSLFVDNILNSSEDFFYSDNGAYIFPVLRIEGRNLMAVLLPENDLMDLYLFSLDSNLVTKKNWYKCVTQVPKKIVKEAQRVEEKVEENLPRINHNGHCIFDPKSVVSYSICGERVDLGLLKVISCSQAAVAAASVCVGSAGSGCSIAIYSMANACGLKADKFINACHDKGVL